MHNKIYNKTPNQEQPVRHLHEGLQYRDLDGLMKPTVHVDEFSSKMAMGAAKEEIEKSFGEKYSQVRNYTTKNESAQEAHEAIRPTNFGVQFAGDDNREKKLYSLIWKRSIASQMAKAEMEKTVITLEDGSKKSKFQAEGEVIRFDGFLKVYIESKDDEEEDGENDGLLPAVTVGDAIERLKLTALERYARPAPRYSEASLVKKLEELGIGRPSTYAPTITTIQKRQYVTTETREGKQRKIAEIIKHNSIHFID